MKDGPGSLESLGARLEIHLLPSLSHMALPNIEMVSPLTVSPENKVPTGILRKQSKELPNTVRTKNQSLGLNPQLGASMPTSTQAGVSCHAYVVVWKSKKHMQRDRERPLLQIPRSRTVTFQWTSRQLGSQLSVPVQSGDGNRAAFLPCDCPSLGHAH